MSFLGYLEVPYKFVKVELGFVNNQLTLYI